MMRDAGNNAVVDDRHSCAAASGGRASERQNLFMRDYEGVGKCNINVLTIESPKNY